MFIGGPPAVGSRPGEGGGRVAAPGDAPGDHDEDGGDIYIMMQCVCVCLSRKIITSS